MGADLSDEALRAESFVGKSAANGSLNNVVKPYAEWTAAMLKNIDEYNKQYPSATFLLSKAVGVLSAGGPLGKIIKGSVIAGIKQAAKQAGRDFAEDQVIQMAAKSLVPNLMSLDHSLTRNEALMLATVVSAAAIDIDFLIKHSGKLAKKFFDKDELAFAGADIRAFEKYKDGPSADGTAGAKKVKLKSQSNEHGAYKNLDKFGSLVQWNVKEPKSATKIYRHKVYGKIYLDSSNDSNYGDIWWSKDRGKHGGSAYKLFKQEGNKLKCFAEADITGKIIPKHKGPKGMELKIKNLIGIK